MPNSSKNSSSRGVKQCEIRTKKEATALREREEKQAGYNWLSEVSSPLSVWVSRVWNMLRDAPLKMNYWLQLAHRTPNPLYIRSHNGHHDRNRRGHTISSSKRCQNMKNQTLSIPTFNPLSIHQPRLHPLLKIRRYGQPEPSGLCVIWHYLHICWTQS